jgi:hypothetical protein
MRYLLFIFFTIVSAGSFAQCDTVFPLNQKIIDLTKAKIGKKVLRGECWDLAKYALDGSNAEWDGLYKFGEELGRSACLMPGDIIQFKNVKVQYKKGNSKFTELMAHHTAIVYEVISEDEVVLIHQNTGYTGRKVGTSSLQFSTIVKGSYKVYRPVSSN